MQSAFANGEFELFYQPIVSLDDNKIASFEALSALEPSKARSGVAGGVHPHRRGYRAYYPAGRMGAADGLCRSGQLA